MTSEKPKYRCLRCKATIRRPGKHSAHVHPGVKPAFEPVEAVA